MPRDFAHWRLSAGGGDPPERARRDLADVERNAERNAEARSGMPHDFAHWRLSAGGGDPPERARQAPENTPPRVGIAFAFMTLDDSRKKIKR